MKRLFQIISSLYFGIFLPLQALRMILTHKKLFILSALPVGLSLLISIYGIGFLKKYLVGFGTAWLANHGYAPNTLTVHAAIFVLNLILWVVAAVLFSFLAGLISAPFNDQLALETEKQTLLRNSVSKKSLTLSDQVSLIKIDIVKSTLLTAAQFILLFLGLIFLWVPGMNLVIGLIAFWLMSLQYLTYPQTRRHEGFFSGLQFIKTHPFSTLGFGAMIGSLFALPLISALCMPLAVVGGTLLYARAKDLTEPPLR